jgi:antitoxin (DNA-binding transcriptional repressor) of toxin-antitoxin stability system
LNRGAILRWRTLRLCPIARTETGLNMAATGAVSLIDVSQLKERLDDVLRRVDQGGEIIDVADRGRVVARMMPAPVPVDSEKHRAIWERRRRLAEEIGKHWTGDVSAAEAVAEGRREL